MIRRPVSFAVFAAFGLAAAAGADEPADDGFGDDGFGVAGFGLEADVEAEPTPARPSTVAHPGEAPYRTWCATCHGISGRGDGPTARWLDPPPRNFTRGEYKWRSTPSGALPTDADLLATIDTGVRGTAMPGWKTQLPLELRRVIVQYIKTFSPRFDTESPQAAVEIPRPPEVTAAQLAEGRKVYELAKCGQCHGETGRGDGPSMGTLKDSQGRPISAYDFTRGYMKVSGTPELFYRTLMTGLSGTPMPSYQQSITAEQIWPLVYYTLSLPSEPSVLDYLFAPMSDQPR